MFRWLEVTEFVSLAILDSPKSILICLLCHLNLLRRLLGHGNESEEPSPSESTLILVQGAGGIIAGATASCITTPLDTIKTRLQV